MSIKPTKIILDTDPGADDIFALLWLLSLSLQPSLKSHIEIAAITTVGGNVPERSTFQAAHKILNLLGIKGIEVGRAAPRLRGEIIDAAHIHGQDGMGNLSHTLPEVEAELSQARCADDVIIDKLSQAPGEIDLVAIGPLTNLAAAETKSPGILSQAKSIVIMGGAFECPGNVTPEAEFNIAFDAHAAAQVFASSDRIVVLPLDITSHLILTSEMLGSITKANPQTKLAIFLDQLGHFMFQTNQEHRETGGVEGCLMHDASAIAYLFYPETLWLQRARVEIETEGKFTEGKTLYDRRHYPKTSPNAFVATQVDANSLMAALAADLKYLLK
jgi:inosine-uridine nucleoside N-ribohydrolase